MKRYRLFGFIITVLLLVGACSDEVTDSIDIEDEAKLYKVSGIVVDKNDDGVPGVTLDFQQFGTATTALDGSWKKQNLEGRITISLKKDGWGFSPGSIDVEEETTDIIINAEPISTMLEIVIHWDELSGTKSSKSTANQFDDGGPTHFGSRLEYPHEDAVFAQAISRDKAEEFGIITLEVPPTNNTELYVVAVRENKEGEGQRGQRDPVIWIGEIKNMEIEEGSSNIIKIEDINWTAPYWDFVMDEVRTAYEEGRMEGDKDEETMSFEIFVYEPIGERAILGLNGSSSTRPYFAEEGKWQIRVHCRNNSVGQESESTCLFWPFVRPEMFNLPDIRFSVPPQAKVFEIEWR